MYTKKVAKRRLADCWQSSPNKDIAPRAPNGTTRGDIKPCTQDSKEATSGTGDKTEIDMTQGLGKAPGLPTEEPTRGSGAKPWAHNMYQTRSTEMAKDECQGQEHTREPPNQMVTNNII